MKNKILKILGEFQEGLSTEETATEIESLIKENYVEKEFVEWSHKLKDSGTIFHNPDGLYSLGDYDLTLAELYAYWQTHIQDK